jgi:hypothetical protein
VGDEATARVEGGELPEKRRGRRSTGAGRGGRGGGRKTKTARVTCFDYRVKASSFSFFNNPFQN